MSSATSRATSCATSRATSRALFGAARPRRPLTRRLAATGAAAFLAASLAAGGAAHAFCGFFVAKADPKLFNESSKVAMVRDGDRTVITMANDYQGPAQDFAMVIPTPTVLEREQINVAENALIAHLDAYTAPRLVEYRDADPCGAVEMMDLAVARSAPAPEAGAAARRDKALGVTVEAEYTVGEYDILILSAKESGGLQTWLDQNGYKTPEAAKPVLASYIAQDMKFFVAKVNLAAQAKTGATYLRPLQIAFESEKFMLPIRLGTVNAKGKQDLVLYALTRNGRVEVSNYRTKKIPSDIDIPLYVQKKFPDFYRAMFAHSVEKAGGRAVFTEYAWDMGWCDPCAADPLSVAQLRQLGAFWVGPETQGPKSDARPVFVTRLHVRYDGETFPEDLRLMATGDTRNFQARFVTRKPFAGAAECPAGEAYRRELAKSYERQARTLADLTGWDLEEIKAEMAANGQSVKALPTGADAKSPNWWKKIWND